MALLQQNGQSSVLSTKALNPTVNFRPKQSIAYFCLGFLSGILTDVAWRLVDLNVTLGFYLQSFDGCCMYVSGPEYYTGVLS